MKALQTLQKLLIELNQLICKIGKTTAQLIDRFNKIALGVTAIDAAQMPTEIQLIAILKNSISGAYKLLHVMLEVMVNLTLAQLKESSLTGKRNMRSVELLKSREEMFEPSQTLPDLASTTRARRHTWRRPRPDTTMEA